MMSMERDVCIIGSGMGGGTLALELARRGLTPLLIEAGDDQPGSLSVNHESAGRPFGLEKSRAIELGGSTNLWHGVVSPLDRRDFSSSLCGQYSGWPLSYEEMLKYWSQALGFLGFDQPALTHFDMLQDRSQKLANDIRFDRSRLRPKLFRVMGKPRRLKHDLREAANAGSIELMTGGTVLELIRSEDDPGRVDRVIVGLGDKKVEIRARRFVIAAGALETPRLLLNSRSFGAAGLGNDAGNVGRYLMDHPMGFLGKIRFRRAVRAALYSDIREKRGNRFRIGLVPTDGAAGANSNLYLRPAIPGATPQAENDILISLIAVRNMRELSLKHLRNLIGNPAVLYRIIANRYALPLRYRAADLFFVTEQTPYRDSRVSLSTSVDRYGYPIARVSWQVSEQDSRNIGQFIERITVEALNDSQYQFDEFPSSENWSKSFTSAAHHLGTARIASHPADGVVDTNLRVHGIRNVWICDGSVFPTGGNANPSLTICALALRLGEHLMEGAL
ncbi:FAD-dependent oxidoreductase [Massilia sp. MS-15]|uniref:FAD-dependent oxidoreductase n=1 Tax=Massilia sp. MS-15 TaxID=2878200 RepID=UPI001CD53D07|nr:GMC family oxidoreductase [Massilia sp. MS-15]MCA1248837.1 GMC family oxidoreductase [Massilia sp. MS-15]